MSLVFQNNSPLSGHFFLEDQGLADGSDKVEVGEAQYTPNTHK